MHDGLINAITRRSGSIVIEVSHGYISDYAEGGITEPVMFADGVLSFTGVKSEFYRSSLEKINPVLHAIEKPEDFDSEYELITGNVLVSPDVFCLQVFRKDFQEGKYFYVEWDIVFNSFELKFDKYILHRDWQNGVQL